MSAFHRAANLTSMEFPPPLSSVAVTLQRPAQQLYSVALVPSRDQLGNRTTQYSTPPDRGQREHQVPGRAVLPVRAGRGRARLAVQPGGGGGTEQGRGAGWLTRVVRPLYSAGLFGPGMHYCTAVFILNCVTLHTLLGAGLACLARHNVPHMGIIVGNRLQTVCICYELLYNWWAEVGPWQPG